MKKFTKMAVAVMAVSALAVTGCGSSGSGSGPAAAVKTVTINGQVSGVAIPAAATKSAAGAVGTVTALDAATGKVISSPATADISADGSFSIKIAPPAGQTTVVLKATVNGSSYRLLITEQLAADATVSGKLVGPDSESTAALVLTDDDKIKTGVDVQKTLERTRYGYVINTGGGKGAGISVIDRASTAVVKTINFTFAPSSNHFGNITADGKELWLCTNKTGAAGDVNVFDLDKLRDVSSVTAENKATFIIKSWEGVGCGVQNTQSPSGQYIFISSDQSPKGINVFDVQKKWYLGNIANENTAPHVGAISSDNKTYYTTTAGNSHTVAYDIEHLGHIATTESAIAPETRRKLELPKVLDIDFGYGNLHALRLHPGQKHLFVGNNTWPVPAGKTNTSGTNVIDLTTRKIIARIDGRPHNYAVSPDVKYLLSTELPGQDCDVAILPTLETGNRLQFIDIATLLAATPDVSKLKAIYHFYTPNEGGSHAAWDLTTGILYYSIYANADGQGYLYALNTAGLSAATPSVVQLSKTKIGWSPHGVSFPGVNGD
ncbi:YncE family protein [Trichlorobacter ammonificans]|uniref:Uncharacterized protein n=1 Tax=Trichlorobacter ammonificans TaxID=2916410 RepID=A0ABN8HLL9_9BACT|nr:hypothetical protein [Trichlorobacter ammonificans]CAH2031959.1 exported protein of unknown function [Trichlorobacter ammonificans]